MNTDSQHLQQVSEEFQHMVEEFFLVQSRYSAAIKEIQTKLEILDDEFQKLHSFLFSALCAFLSLCKNATLKQCSATLSFLSSDV